MGFSLGFCIALVLFTPSVLASFVIQSYYIDTTATLAKAFWSRRIAESLLGGRKDLAVIRPTLEETMSDSRLFSALNKVANISAGEDSKFGQKEQKYAKDPMEEMEELTSLGNCLMDIVDCLDDTLQWIAATEVVMDITLVLDNTVNRGTSPELLTQSIV